jgi:hypothetical protein
MDDHQRYLNAAHAMQSGVALDLNANDDSLNPKHLRVGVNSAMSDHGALVKLLIDKGIFSEQEYMKVIADFMEREKESYERKHSQRLGRPIKLG